MNPAVTSQELTPTGLCEDCKSVEIWIQVCVQSQGVPTSFGPHEIQLGTTSEIAARNNCKICYFLTKALEASFDPPLPPQYTTYTGTWEDSITLLLDNLTAKSKSYEIGFEIRFSSLRAIAVEPFGGMVLNEENMKHEGYKFYPTVRLVVNDVSRLAAATKPAIRLGRLVNPTQCNVKEVCQIYASCVSVHGGQCEVPRNASENKNAGGVQQLPPPLHGFRVVDVKKKCIVKVKKACRYVALSYVWGKTPFLQTRLANIAQLETPGSLGGQNAKVPRTLWEAMSLTEMLGERYLWIDALCIIQDDDASKMHQIAQMDRIYLHACLTVVAGDGADADAGLSGFTPGSRQFHQNIVNIAGLQFVSLTAPILKAFDELKWHSRAWTYQEFMLSKRLLVFTNKQVYYSCNQQHYAEDSILLNKLEPPWHEQRLQVNFARVVWDSDRWFSYMTLVRDITRRDMTMPMDIVRAVSGVLSSMTKYTGEEFVCGLPGSMLEIALMWQPLGPLTKRGMAYSGYPFPTWSWIGWQGKARYPENYLPYVVYPIISAWTLYIPKHKSRPRQSDGSHMGDWTLAEITRDCIACTPRALKEIAKEAGDYTRTSWTATQRPTASYEPTKVSRRTVFKAIAKTLVSSDNTAASNLLDHMRVEISLETAVLHFAGQTKVLFIDPAPTPYFHADLQTAQTGVFRIVNHANQWVGTIHLALPPPFGDATAPIRAEFVAIAASSTSYEDTNEINPGLNVGQNTFDTGLWQQLNPTGNEVRLLNVLWIHWVGDVAQRVGAGQVHVDAWPVGELVNRDIWLV